MKKTLLVSCLVLGLLVGCNTGNTKTDEEVTVTTGQIIAEEQLDLNSEVDFIFYNDVVYVLSEEKELELTKEKLDEVGKIETQYTSDVDTSLLSATKLDEGSTVYAIDDSMTTLVVDQGNELKAYEVIPEG
ncbi:hypothetical protein HXA34_01465 [Salipaludibacillus agaradhaerens]|jgi:hypothetical protein|uniref:hypothetical protein n=1 Tax=Salipaludibacillus agaradhaerens TaxID=76935 RepID=UPI0021519E28|nr:hypothetical protein [Salipaludibacillus agaradhaerens]MCR6104950.1 hypothetical protein [Salipaludibacillus agaradhaerens]MCR6116996.1 hypothetical protein [Salipaludibacillus agaradhaerens]